MREVLQEVRHGDVVASQPSARPVDANVNAFARQIRQRAFEKDDPSRARPLAQPKLAAVIFSGLLGGMLAVPAR